MCLIVTCVWVGFSFFIFLYSMIDVCVCVCLWAMCLIQIYSILFYSINAEWTFPELRNYSFLLFFLFPKLTQFYKTLVTPTSHDTKCTSSITNLSNLYYDIFIKQIIGCINFQTSRYSIIYPFISGHPSATGRAQDGERTLARD